MQTKPLVMAAILILILQFTGAFILIARRLPYEFAGTGNPENVAQDFLRGGGTELSAPLIPLLILTVFLFISFNGKGDERKSNTRMGIVSSYSIFSVLLSLH